MGTKTHNNYEDLITFTRASRGHALRPVSYGTELVTNGDFSDTDLSDWTAGGSATLSVVSGELKVLNPSSANYGYAVQSISTKVGAVYSLDVDFNYIEANGLVRVGTSSGGDEILTESLGSANEGSHRFTFVATTTTTHIRVGLSVNTADVEARFDNISVKEVTFDVGNNLVLFEHPVNVPRVEWDSAGNRLGLLVEEARTNLDTQSTYFAGAASVTATKNYTAPDGSQDASTLDYTAVSTPYLNTTNISFSSGTTYSFSFYFKRGTGTQAVQTLLYGSTFNSGGANCVVVFDLDNETTSVASGTFVSHSITNVGGGWYRCMCSATATATASQNQQILRLGAADAGNYDYIFGKQVEAGSFPTSYIKSNSGSTTTRSADVASIPVADFGYNNSNECTLFCHISGMSYEDGGTGYPVITRLDNASNANDRRGFFVSEPSELLRSEVVSGGSGQAGLTATTGSGGSFGDVKMAFAMAENDFAVSGNGGAVETDTSGTVASSLPINKLIIANVTSLNGHIKSIKYYPRRLTNAQLQEITS